MASQSQPKEDDGSMAFWFALGVAGGVVAIASFFLIGFANGWIVI